MERKKISNKELYEKLKFIGIALADIIDNYAMNTEIERQIQKTKDQVLTIINQLNNEM